MTDISLVRTGYLLTVLLAVTTAVDSGLAQSSSSVQPQDGSSDDSNVPVANGEIVSELGTSAMYVFQAKNSDYWFGSNDRGVYRYNGRVIVNFTTRFGPSSRIRRETSGSLTRATLLSMDFGR